MSGHRASLAVAALVAAVAFTPFVRGLAAGHAFYFRDLSRQFFPERRFVAEGLRAGEVRFWNPYTHEGLPTASPLAYPVDLLHALAPREWFLSLLLALHVPLAAAGFFALARDLGLRRAAAAGGALAFALGGFSLSSLSLYVHLQALGWAPLVLLGLRRAATSRARGMACGAVAVALAVSTTALEIVAQTVLAGALLALSVADARGRRQLAAAVILGVGIASVAIVPTLSQVEYSARGAGFPVDVVVSHSIHPVSLVQTLVGDWHFDLNDPMGRFWGDRLLGGYPYLLSLYLGVPLLALAAAGVATGGRTALTLVPIGVVCLLVSLGPAVGLDRLAAITPALRMFRFPCKAFFMVHLVAALLAALGLDALSSGRRRAWSVAAFVALLLGGALTAARALPHVAPRATRWLAGSLFPPDWSAAAQAGPLDAILSDAARGGVVAVALGLVSVMVWGGRLRPTTGAWTAAALATADLLRTGAGLNPMVSASFYAPSSEATTMAARIRASGGRLFTCEPEFSPAFHRARATARAPDVWTMAAYQEMMLPNSQLSLAVPTAYSLDLTGLVPSNRLIDEPLLDCRRLDALLPRLRTAGVAWVLSADPLSHPQLRLDETLRPARTVPLTLMLYALADPIPLHSVEEPMGPMAPPAGEILAERSRSGRIELTVAAERAAYAVARDAHGRGWSARVNGESRPVLGTDGRDCAVAVPAGTSHVTLLYRPPHLGAGLAMSALCAALAMGAWLRGGRAAGVHAPPAIDARARGLV